MSEKEWDRERWGRGRDRKRENEGHRERQRERDPPCCGNERETERHGDAPR